MILKTPFIMTMTVTGLIAGSALAHTPMHMDTSHPQLLRIEAVSSSSEEVLKGAASFITKVSERGLSFLSDEKLTQEQREKEFRKLLNDSFDLKTIGKFALGRYWRTATPAQRDEYLELFEDMIIETYARRFEEYQGQQIQVGNARSVGSNGDSLVHSSIISTNSPAVSVDWRVRKNGNKYQVIDVLVEGVSMSVTQRSEFSSIIQRGGGNIDALLEKLRSR